MPGFRRVDLSLAMVLLGAAALRLWGVDYGLPHTLARPDEDAVFAIAQRVYTGHLNPEFFDWPSLFMYVVAACSLLYFTVGRLAGWFGRMASFVAATTAHPGPLYLIARSISVAAGTATVATVYRIGLLLFDRTTALVAAMYLAIAALHVRESHFGLTDVPATCLLMLAFLFTVRYARGGVRRDALLAAVMAGLAASTKYNAGIVVLPLVWAIATNAGGGSVVNRVGLVLVCALLSVAAFAAGTPYAFLDPHRFVSSLVAISEHLRRGHIAAQGYSWRIHMTSSLRYGIGTPMLVSGIAGGVLYVYRDLRAGVLFVSCPVVYFAVIGAGQTTFARYILPVVPFLCIASAYVTVETARAIAAWSGRPAPAPVIAWMLAALIAMPALLSSIQTDRLLARTDNRVIAAEWIRAHFPDGARIFHTGRIYAHVQLQSGFVPDPHYPSVDYDATPPADLVVVAHCPLAYCDGPPDALYGRLTDYELLEMFTALDEDNLRLVYDKDDAFFVPLAGFEAVTRPGPTLLVYGRSPTAADPPVSRR